MTPGERRSGGRDRRSRRSSSLFASPERVIRGILATYRGSIRDKV
jgi:hypothetical protein